MGKIIRRPISEPVRKQLTTEQLWNDEDQGIIKSWEVGRALREKAPDLATAADRGELPILHWKGGVREGVNEDEKVDGPDVKVKKQPVRYGSFFYLAELQGLRGENLDIDDSTPIKVVCSKSKVEVTFTSELKLLGAK